MAGGALDPKSVAHFYRQHCAKRNAPVFKSEADFEVFRPTGATRWSNGRPPSWICYVRVRTTHEGHLVVFIAVQNLVVIDRVVLIICMFFDFTTLA